MDTKSDYVPTIKVVLRNLPIGLLFLGLAWYSLQAGYLAGTVLFGLSMITVAAITTNRIKKDIVKIRYKKQFDSA